MSNTPDTPTNTSLTQRVLARLVPYMEDWCRARGARQPSREVLAAAAVAVTGGSQTTETRARNTLDQLCTQPFLCANCSDRIEDAAATAGAIYCSMLCKDESELVRYFRRRRTEDRAEDPGVKKAIKKKLAFVVSGGYDRPKVPERVRSAVKDRDGGLCRACGQPGEDIDHINGDSATMANLQLLCKECHDLKTLQSLKVITFVSSPYRWVHARLLRARVGSKLPLQLCDNERDWENVQPEIRRRRKLTRQPALF